MPRKRKVRPPSPAPRVTVALRALAPPLMRCARDPGNAWLFVFLPALCVCVALSKWHFAPKSVGTLEVRRGFESAASAIFAAQLYGYSGNQDIEEQGLNEKEDTGIRGREERPSIVQSPVLSVVASGGFGWAEGPLWVLRPGHEGDASYGRLLFSAVFDNSIFKIEYDGVSRYVRASGCREKEERERGGLGCSALIEPGSNGLAYDPIDGGLFLCEHGSRSVTRLEENGTHTPVVTHADGGKRLNSPNDLVFSSRGDLFFTDPTFGLQGTAPDAQEMPHCGVYHIPREALAEMDSVSDGDDNGGGGEEEQEEEEKAEKARGANGSREAATALEPRLLVSDIPTPNGLAFSPDESVLYIANSGPKPEILAFDVMWGEKKWKKNKSAKKDKVGVPTTKKGARNRKKKKKKKKTKRQSLDELLQELDEEDEDAGVANVVVGVINEEAAIAKSAKPTKKEKAGSRMALSNKRIFVDFTALSERCDRSAPRNVSGSPYNGPDGIKVDALGNVFVAGACGVHVFRPSDGERVASLILPGVRVSNIAFAGDGHLYITASDRVMRIRVGDTVLPPLPERMISGENTHDEDDGKENVGGYFW